MKKFDVQCCGLLVADLIAKPVDILPNYKDLPAVVADLEWHLGGCASNTAVDLARLGAKVGVVGAIGNDEPGNFVLKKLQDGGVDVSAVKRFDFPTSQSMIAVDSEGKRCFIHDPRINELIKQDDLQASVGPTRKFFTSPVITSWTAL